MFLNSFLFLVVFLQILPQIQNLELSKLAYFASFDNLKRRNKGINIPLSSILEFKQINKIDTIQKEIKSGKSLTDAIFVGGKRRFYPIVMTSLTTILALIPLLIFGEIGVELQIPLALSIIGGLFVGTIVSLFFIPIMFYYFAVKIRN